MKNGTAASGSQGTVANAAGYVRPMNITIKSPPYKLTSCEQVLFIKGKKISDMENYLGQTDAFFTMSIYMVNMFDNENVTTLLESINIQHMNEAPYILSGSKTCIKFVDAQSGRIIPMCLSNEADARDILTAYQDFMSCRMGAGLKKFDPLQINNILEASCQGRDVANNVQDLQKVRNLVKGELTKNGVNIYINLVHCQRE